MTIADWKPLNREQAEQLFDEHAVLLGKHDAVPVHIAAQLLPSECTEYVCGWTCHNARCPPKSGMERG